MVNQEQIPPQQEQPFVAAKQVSSNLKDINFNTNNEVALLYLEHNNQDYFKCVSDFISKCCLRKPFTSSPDMYKEYLAEFWYLATALENYKVSFSIPTGGILGEWFPMIGYGEEVSAKETLRKSLLPPMWSLANGINIDYANIFWEDIILKLKKKQRKKVVPYTRFISLLIMHKMMEGYGDDEITLYPTKVFSVNNWALKSNQPEEPPFTDHMLAICVADKPVVFKAPKPSSIAERVPQGTKHGAQLGHKKQSSLKQPSVSSKETTKGGSSKAPTGSKTDHSKKRKESISGMDSNPSQPLVSTTMDPEKHKEDQQATGGPTSLEVTSEARANPRLSSGTDPHVLVEQTKSVSEGLDTVLTQPLTRKGANSIARQPSFKDLDSPEDDPVIILESDAEEDDGIHAETEDTSVPKSSSLKSSLIQELTNQVLILQSQKHKLELENNKAEAEATLLKVQPSFPNVEQLNELLVKFLKTEFSNILSAHNFSSSLPTELKNLPLKFNKLTEEVKDLNNQVHNLEIELLGDLKEIPPKLEDFTKTVTSLTSQVAKLKTLQWELP
ncbi:hypothetical protein Tco_0025388 [Tanacetum coccineum]